MSTTTLAEWPAGTFLESIAVDPDGSVHVANHDRGTIERIGPDRRIVEFARLPGVITGILRIGGGTTLATGRVKGQKETVYRVSPDGTVEVFAVIAEGRFLNGLTRLDSRSVLIADSTGGTLWRVDLDTRVVTVWARHDLLAHPATAAIFPENTMFPAANGVKRFGDHVYVSNSARASIIRIPVDSTGLPGAPSVWADRILADDFSIDTEGALYVATHPMNTIVRIASDGSRKTIATGAEGTIGATAVAIVPDGSALLVVGNSLIPYNGRQEPARLVSVPIRSGALRVLR